MYMMFLCSAHPPNLREAPAKPEQRSLFRDVIESLRIRSQLPEDYNQSDDENNLAQNYERYSQEEDQPLQLPSDSGFIPRRNDRVELSALRYRSPKNLDSNFTVDIETTETPKGEIVVFIDTSKEKSTTAKPKKVQKKPSRPSNNKIKNKVNENSEDVNEEESPDESLSSLPMSNTMAGQSQIGNREQQIVLKPTVIVNFRGSVMHKDGEIKMGGGRKNEQNETINEPPQNVFNINQEIKLERTFSGISERTIPTNNLNTRGEVVLEHKVTTNVDNDMIMHEKSSPEKVEAIRQERQIDNVLQIVFSV